VPIVEIYRRGDFKKPNGATLRARRIAASIQELFETEGVRSR
jgi:hypothetical protein